MTIKIRKATIKDVDTIVDLWKEFRNIHSCIVVNNNPELKPYTRLKSDATKIWKGYILKQLASKDAYVQIGYVDNKIAGFNLSFVKDNIPVFSLEKIGNIGDLYVKKEFRGLGISSKFKNNAIKWFKKKGLNYASIQVWDKNIKSKEIYKNWGFEDVHIEMRKKI